jgi:rod shape-determining protein MreD
MTDYSERLLAQVPRRSRTFRFRPAGFVLVPVLAILFQVYLPRFFRLFGYLELPLLVTVYFALMRRKPISGLLLGAAVGLGQDSLSHQPLGMFGIAKTLVGYFAASVSLRFDVDNPIVRLILSYFFFVFHQFFFWVLSRALLAQDIGFNTQQTFLFALLNAFVAVPLFLLLDKMKE